MYDIFYMTACTPHIMWTYVHAHTL